MNKEQIKVGMRVVCMSKQCTVVQIIDLPGGGFLVEVEADGNKLRVAGTGLSPLDDSGRLAHEQAAAGSSVPR